MIENVNQFLGSVAGSELARTARHAARTIWNAHLAALETTRVEAGKVITLAIGEGRRLARRVKPAPAVRSATRSTRKSTRRTTRRAA